MSMRSAVCLSTVLVLLAVGAPSGALADEIALQKALDSPVDFAVTDAPIAGVFARLGKATGVKFVIDDDTLAALPYGSQTRLDVTMKRVRLRNGLDRLLAQQALRWRAEDETVRIVPSEALYRVGRRATYEELATLGKIHSVKLQPTSAAGSAMDQLRKATGSKELNLFFHLKTDREAAVKRGEAVLPGTAATWLDMICHGKGWTWYLSGDELIIVERKVQVERQLSKRVSLRYASAELVTVLLDLAREARIELKMEPGVLRLLPEETRSNFNLVMTDATVAQAMEVISGATGLEFVRTNLGVAVKPSKGLEQPTTAMAAPRQRARFFVRLSLPLKGGQTIEVFLRPEELPDDVVEAIEAETDKLIERLSREGKRTGQ
jgi:hypothetical protein